MATVRKPFQGVLNIIRFNWHFYILATIAVITLLWLAKFFNYPIQLICYLLVAGVVATTFISLLVSMYVYDFSGLYNFQWLTQLGVMPKNKVANIHAGFDETSALLKTLFPIQKLYVFDFYDPRKHTEVSIKRARKAYPPFPNTKTIRSSHLPVSDHFFDEILVLLAAHEIRDTTERIMFFRELERTLLPKGNIVVTEHLRDLPNFLAYNIGFLHFLSRKTWLATFQAANLKVVEEVKVTPFISTFILSKNDTTS